MLTRDAASFRDPSGFIYRDDRGILLRQVNECYRSHFDQLVHSGLLDVLIQQRLLVEHEETSAERDASPGVYKVIRPRELNFISYPYEWSFSALKDAALLTLDIQRLAIEYGMTLKDASAYNIQLDGSRPIFIDTLSFERYDEGGAWVAYGQFCRHFLAPLALMSKVDVRLNSLLAAHVDGVPLDLASRLLPNSTWLNVGLVLHLHLQSRMVKRDALKQAAVPAAARISKAALLAIIASLRRTINSLRWKTGPTTWSDYYSTNNYSDAEFTHKKHLVSQALRQWSPCEVWDFGANTGVFSRIACELGCRTCAFDMDPGCVEAGYRFCRDAGESLLVPLLLDLSNPTPGTGWANREHRSLLERGPTDVILALALVHHLAIANNVPLDDIADFFALLGRNLIIEWVPKSDRQVQRLLASRTDIFSAYGITDFERAFARHFSTLACTPIANSGRVLYVMRRHH